MKRILGLDLGTNSIGWALVDEAQKEGEQAKIVKLGVRVNPLTTEEKKDFEKGNPISTNANRTLKRGARRNLQRYKMRRENLTRVLIDNGFIHKDAPLTETGKNSTYQTLFLRAKAAKKKISLEEFARILLSINKKRGYKSSRKVVEDDGQAIDGMSVAKELYDNNLTPGQYVLQQLLESKNYIPDFYQSDLKDEFNRIWNFQHRFYPEILSQKLHTNLQGKNKKQTWVICKEQFNIVGIKFPEKGRELKKKHYDLRSKALYNKLDLEYLAVVLQEINNDLNKSNDYLGAISDRSKELYFKNETVGENLYKQIRDNPHQSLKNQVFYRQDYLDEFERIWQTQSKFHSELTQELKEEIRDVVIFYQRRLKSQKGLISFCLFESWEEEYHDKKTGKAKTRTIGKRVIPKSSPLFQEFKIWQNLNNLKLIQTNTKENRTLDLFSSNFELDLEAKQLLFEELNIRGNLNQNQILKIIGLKTKEWKTNYPNGLEGNRTNAKLYNIYQHIAEEEGYGHDWSKKTGRDLKTELTQIFPLIKINPEILNFEANLDGELFDKQPSYQFWHLLYSAESDEKISESDKILYGNTAVNLKKKIVEKYGFKPEYAKLLANISLQQDYGSLSTKAIRNILPKMQDGYDYYEACNLVGYNHSKFLTKEENDERLLADKLKVLPKNALRNPVVEKILNQMINVVNELITTYGRPDEIRLELARELKKSAKERNIMTKSIAAATRRNEDIRKIISKEFGIPNPTKTDVIRYRLWEELASNAYKDIFTNQPISKLDLYSSKIDIEHIIPRSLLFDDSYSNKTLAFKKDNLKKDNRTAYDFIANDYADNLKDFILRVENLYDKGKGAFSKAKRNKLLMSLADLPKGFIARDLRNSQYIAKKAKEILLRVSRNVLSTTGSITDRLRKDWDLINVMKELNLPKYRVMGLTQMEKRYDVGREAFKEIEVISEWTKRNDHRHHAMDALTVAFTTHNHIQYINNLNARRDENNKKHIIVFNIEKLITYFDSSKSRKRIFKPPMPYFRTEAKKHIESILVSIKNKNKVVTKNINKTKRKSGYNRAVQLTPRGQLHKETIYGKSLQLSDKPMKINKKFSIALVKLIINREQQKIVMDHLAKYHNNPIIAFSTKELKNKPLYYKNEKLKEVLCYEEIYTIRKAIAPDLKVDKVIDEGIKNKLRERLNMNNNNPKLAFTELEKNPIWLNQEKGISIKRVTIKAINNGEPLHFKKDHLGNEIKNGLEERVPVDFVSTGNNHHVAIYKDKVGNLQEYVMSFYEAVVRATNGISIVDKEYNKEIGWEFQFTLKQNEMFVYPNDDFDVNAINFLDEENYSLISKHLFRVQKIRSKDYWFRHHLETSVTNNLDFTFKRINTPTNLNGIIKIRINHIGKIVQVGEY